LAESQQLAFSLNAWIKDVLKSQLRLKSSLVLPVYAQLCGRLELKDRMYLRRIPLLF
jgi:urease accessory protein